MDSANTINKKIISLYEQWRDEIKQKNSYLLSEKFSNIFCTGIAEDWENSSMRILVVGEEATWKSRSKYKLQYTENTELSECQKWIVNDLRTQLYGDSKKRSSPFWRRMRKIKNAYPKASFCHTNIDCINADTCRALKETDRKALHDCDVKLVRQIIELINPTHIVFFGWHNTSLNHEFPELIKKVYPDKYGDTSYMKKNGYIVKTEYNGIHVVFTYHPSWLKTNSNSYIDRIIETLSDVK